MRGPNFHPLPPGYSGPAPEPEKKAEQVDIQSEQSLDDTLPLDLSTEPTATGSAVPASKIHTFEQNLGRRHEDSWERSPNVTGSGAIHCKSFHCKLTGDSLEFLDQQINEWLDKHPQYEVKMVTSSIGTWTGKLKEPNLIMTVWV
jgi:hypothetical protein